jgi:hypothetical protein
MGPSRVSVAPSAVSVRKPSEGGQSIKI